MMSDLLLTLGHNSSAILVDNNRVVCGFEEERLSGVKSDSRFPLQAIDACMRYGKPSHAYVTHWATDGNVNSLKEKYWQPRNLGLPITSLNGDFTHHDSHIWAAKAFAGPDFPTDNTIGLVIDGFGNFGEHLTIYKMLPTGPKVIQRYYGYKSSLGLMYQYATAFMGLKMHEDEYKLLGYETRVATLGDETRHMLDQEVARLSNRIINDMEIAVYSPYDPLVSVDALPAIQVYWRDLLMAICERLELSDPTSFTARIALAYLIQHTLEAVVRGIIKPYNPTNLLVSGGVFYNVRLNFALLTGVAGRFCAYPLAGDQGNALGLYAYQNADFKFPSHLFWGRRDFDVFRGVKLPDNFYVLKEADAIPFIKLILKKYGYVNIVRGSMEFGPRALCHTTTLAWPSPEVVDIINIANGRSTVMPMAPVMDRALYNEVFYQTEKPWKSEEYMITSLEYRTEYVEEFLGAAHKYPDGSYTGRPQVTDDPFMLEILDGGLLINTSFNVHGKPIVHTMLQAMEHHNQQRQKVDDFVTIVIKE
jgi:carbamoyltransferase